MTGEWMRPDWGMRFLWGPEALVFQLDGAKAEAENAFREGLWRSETAEWFFGVPGNYVEVHLSPTGAWWLAAFEEKRVLSTREGRPEGRVEREGATLSLIFDCGAFERWAGFSMAGVKGNACAILPGPTHWSFAALGGKQPDFHRPEDFVDLPGE